MFYNEWVLMFSVIERFCINCLRLIYIISLVNSSEKFLIQTANAKRAFCAGEPWCSPNQVRTHAARAAASQLNKPLCGRARRARRALVKATVVHG